MKYSFKNPMTILFMILLCSLLTVFQNCGGYSAISESVETSSVVDELPVNTKPKASIGINSFESIFMNMAVVTKVDFKSCRSAYNKVKYFMTTTNDIMSFSDATQSAAISLANCFCARALIINGAAGREKILPGVDLDKKSGALNDADFAAISKGLTDIAWGSSDDKKIVALRSEITELLKKLRTAEAEDSVKGTNRIAFGGCTAVLASLPTHTL